MTRYIVQIVDGIWSAEGGPQRMTMNKREAKRYKTKSGAEKAVARFAKFCKPDEFSGAYVSND